MNNVKTLPLLTRALQKDAACYPEKIIQFGTGNFLKGFINWIIQQLNDKTDLNAGVVAVKLRRGNESQVDDINVQDGLFTLNVRGLDQGNLVDTLVVIKSQNRALSPYINFENYLKLAESEELQWIVSNTTEAGIRYEPLDSFTDTPAESFPGKLTQLLYRRYCYFNGDQQKGLRIFCCELIDNNASVLRNIILQYSKLWHLEPGFSDWIVSSCQFCNTLVDRIVTGKPKAARSLELQQQLGYTDRELIETERYYQWVIEAEAGDESALAEIFPKSAGLNIVLTPDLSLYRQRKVRILNGAHTGCVALARLLNIETVYAGMQDDELSQFMRYLVYEEICPTIALPKDDVKAYADAILERFANPFLHHEWKSIGLNSVSKWRARLLPVLTDSQDELNLVPPGLATSLAALILLYRGHFQDTTFELNDDQMAIDTIASAWQSSSDVAVVVKHVFSSTELWGSGLSDDQSLINAVTLAILSIQSLGLREHLSQLLDH